MVHPDHWSIIQASAAEYQAAIDNSRLSWIRSGV
jgi:hypothetical protein